MKKFGHIHSRDKALNFSVNFEVQGNELRDYLQARVNL
jgi:hypothetical protein